ncbi:unnamed protein product [Urochloa humidicola]
MPAWSRTPLWRGHCSSRGGGARGLDGQNRAGTASKPHETNTAAAAEHDLHQPSPTDVQVCSVSKQPLRYCKASGYLVRDESDDVGASFPVIGA